MTPVMCGATHCGRNSLPIYCLGVLLTLASHLALVDISDGPAMQIALSLGGILLMIVPAMLLNSVMVKPKRQPVHHDVPANGDVRLVRSPIY